MDLTRIARGGTPIDLDRPRIVFFDMLATERIYRRYKTTSVAVLYTSRRIEPAHKGGKPGYEVELTDITALQYFLWAGLQADAEDAGDTLTLDDVASFINPISFERIFNAVIVALSNCFKTPALPGKADAATASPVAAAPVTPGPTAVSTSMTRNASPSPSSGKVRRGSGRKR